MIITYHSLVEESPTLDVSVPLLVPEPGSLQSVPPDEQTAAGGCAVIESSLHFQQASVADPEPQY